MTDQAPVETSKSTCSHVWQTASANLPPADVGFWRHHCLACGAYMNDAGRLVLPLKGTR